MTQSLQKHTVITPAISAKIGQEHVIIKQGLKVSICPVPGNTHLGGI